MRFERKDGKWAKLSWFQREDRYEGEVIDGEMCGSGIYWHEDGTRYEGEVRSYTSRVTLL